ncbi:hypothetical protein Ksed_00650 [Kytococcus sedentarius DSM 20547]|uniref:Uncharacterized protein n=1 Tax=Kytococcus sedentarius (strain ATCC 14392 / DSM 20547 / JCM 11482 / CCUG 33030 / NBRC 15357 / NCTC 11040 / CCM 314 / 541) TaxID=478801 RepID=C7NIJ1_KYTSD|nr:hypothetical protein Ksed_00650 [Kytococcus sedentarius DSM 20547]
MLMRTSDRRVDRHRPVDLPGGIGLGEDLHQHAMRNDQNLWMALGGVT